MRKRRKEVPSRQGPCVTEKAPGGMVGSGNLALQESLVLQEDQWREEEDVVVVVVVVEEEWRVPRS